MLFLWQSPMMPLKYSVVCFLAGMSSAVIRPLVEAGGVRDNEAKTVVIYGVAVLLCCETFAGRTGEYYMGRQLVVFWEGLVATKLGSSTRIHLFMQSTP